MELKKTHSTRLVGGVEMGSRAERTRGRAGAGGPEAADCGMGQARLQIADPTRWWLADPAAPHSCLDKPGGMQGSEVYQAAWGSNSGK